MRQVGYTGRQSLTFDWGDEEALVKTPSDDWSSGKSCANRCDRKKEPALLMEDGEGVLYCCSLPRQSWTFCQV